MKATSYLIKLASSLENKYSSEEDFNSAISPSIKKQLAEDEIKKQNADDQDKINAAKAVEQARKYHEEMKSRMPVIPPKAQSPSGKELLKIQLENLKKQNEFLKQRQQQQSSQDEFDMILQIQELKNENEKLKQQSFEEEPIEESPKPDRRLIPDRSYNY
jgi:hypothetical protein